MSDCAFCTLPELKDRTIVRDNLAWAFLTNIPITPGHTLIIPVRHIQKLEDLTNEELNTIFKMTMEIKNSLKEALGAEGFNYAWNEEKVAGQSVPHFHLHIVPRKQGDEGITEYEPRKFLYRPGSREATPEAELQSITEQIKNRLKKTN